MSCEGDYIKWIYTAFGECISTVQEKVGFALGLSSTIIWMYAQIPQIYMNFKNKSAEGLSFAFLLLLVTGDSTNLIGALINHGLLTQIITAIWFMIVDVFCAFQYVFYVWLIPRCSKKKKRQEIVREEYDQIIPAIPLLVAAASAKSYPDPYKPPELYGSLLGWVSAVSYLGSRLPQMIKNFRRKKTEGVSWQFFVSAILGNTTYAASIFLKDPNWGYIWGQFPWLVGSAGNLFFDFTILFQFFYYGSDDKAKNDKSVSTITTDLSSDKKPLI
ncbi:PQ loop repeat family protein [Tritrichomonas foetus]|uniref:PQ loop repeat family protein n=1 Tax=Tritrichomonas foetus TaxID=1144522 RepID=A0A1J4JCM8_9EUKA|nr:PQ loop repeat family protein [Tritrichomonas foetus]|eukprot:OHS96425.1 PQ loop repeat family protein [Tritrichomonas foetus]